MSYFTFPRVAGENGCSPPEYLNGYTYHCNSLVLHGYCEWCGATVPPGVDGANHHGDTE